MSVGFDRPFDPGERQLAMAHRRWVRATRSFVEFPREALERSIPERFEVAVGLHPGRVAIKCGEQVLAYAALNQLANRLAHALVARLGAQNEPVGLLLGPGVAPIVAILGVLKAGKCYVALDPEHPSARLAKILDDAQPRLLVTNRQSLALAEETSKLQTTPRTPVDLVLLEDLGDDISGENPGLAISADQSAVIFYTSGTTGQPKGVVHNHRNLLHRTMTLSSAFRLCCDDREPQFWPYRVARSLAILDMLLNGGTILPYDVKAMGVSHLAEWLVENQITVLPMTSGLFRQLVEALPQPDDQRFSMVRLVAMTGEPITRQEVALWQQHFAADSVLVHSLGSSEAMRVAHLVLDRESPIPEGRIPVGYPSLDKEIALVDEDGALVEPGSVGEIVVKSRYLSPGYWRRPALTKAVFRPDPEGSDKRLYFTGDLGRIREDGALELVGRKDLQVKVRGHTIQLAEVEMALLDTPNVKEAVVLARPTRDGDQRLIAYVVAKTLPAPGMSDLRSALRGRLPDYMIPPALVLLDTLPRIANGKVDRQALPAPSGTRPHLATPFAAPRTDIESRIAGIWAELLELDEVGIHDNFFELGGDSLSAMHMILEIESLAARTAPPGYFRVPTVAALAGWYESGALADEPPSLAFPRQADAAGRGSRGHLVRLITGQIAANAVVRRAVENQVLRLPFEQGLRWLAWVSQPTIASRLYRDERDLFCRLGHDLGNPAAANDDSFRASVLGNVIWLCYQRTWWNSQRSPDGPIGAMQRAPHQFWRSLAERLDHASGEERGRLVNFAGLEHLYRAHKLGRGTIMVSYHSPATPIANAIVSRYIGLGHIPTISQVSAQQMAMRDLFGESGTVYRQSAWSATFALQGQRILRAGGALQVLNDVSYDDGVFLRSSVGGRSYNLKPGFAELALTTGATILPVHCAYDRMGCIHMTMLPALDPLGNNIAHAARVDHLLSQYSAFLEDAWRKAPESLGWGSLRRFHSRPRFVSND